MDYYDMSAMFRKRRCEVSIVETTTFQDPSRKEEKTEKKYSNIHELYRALAKAGVKGEVIYNLKKHNKAIVEYDDAKTVIEIKGQPKIVLTDGDDQ